MIVVAGGSSARFGADKLLVDIAGAPLITHTLQTVRDHVDQVVLVGRADNVETLQNLAPEITVVPGGKSRTESEIAGLRALEETFEEAFELIGIHDGARPLVSSRLVERLFATAGEVGGAVPVLKPAGLLVDRMTLEPVDDAVTVQTPQVFWGPDLIAAYREAEMVEARGHDTVDIVQRFSDLRIAAVPGEPENIKVTYRADIDLVERALVSQGTSSDFS